MTLLRQDDDSAKCKDNNNIILTDLAKESKEIETKNDSVSKQNQISVFKLDQFKAKRDKHGYDMARQKENKNSKRKITYGMI